MSGTLKILGIFLGSGNVEEMNWRPRIVAVKNVLNSWRKRGLSFRGKALIVNALALARVLYVDSLIHSSMGPSRTGFPSILFLLEG